jgi:hypothetical protein
MWLRQLPLLAERYRCRSQDRALRHPTRLYLPPKRQRDRCYSWNSPLQRATQHPSRQPRRRWWVDTCRIPRFGFATKAGGGNKCAHITWGRCSPRSPPRGCTRRCVRGSVKWGSMKDERATAWRPLLTAISWERDVLGDWKTPGESRIGRVGLWAG